MSTHTVLASTLFTSAGSMAGIPGTGFTAVLEKDTCGAISKRVNNDDNIIFVSL